MSRYSSVDDIPRLADESAHSDRAIEWWFFQGYYDGKTSGRRHFMLSFFRHKVDVPGSAPSQGFSCILSVLDPQTNKHETLNQIDPSVIDLFTHLNKEMWRANLDQQTVDVFTHEIKTYGPFHPVRQAGAAAEVRGNPLSIKWDMMDISQTDEAFQLSFTEPESQRRCSFELRPLHPRMFIEEADSPRVDAMAYATYPRLTLKGRADNEKVHGEVWMDHQWGDFGGWFLTQPRDGKLLGWDWLGINLDDGTDLIVMVHRDMQNGQPAGQFAVRRKKGEDPVLCEEFTLSPGRTWESGRTHISYPVAWRLDIPAFGLTLDFEPLTDDQEINIFGLIRAIWEGAGTVRGSMEGGPVSGRARLELYGYGFIFDFKKQMDAMVQQVDASIEKFFPKVLSEEQITRYTGAPHWKHEPAAYNEVLTKPIWDLMGRSSKYWRPLFGILLLEALGVRHEPFEMLVSCVSEMTHTGALIIDDIEDASEIRRGDACIHLRYGTDIAINAGNTLYFLPYLLLEDQADLTDLQRVQLYRTLIRQSTKCHFGQSLDLYWSRNMDKKNLGLWMNDSIAPKILQMYAYKTASASEGMAEVACITAGSAEDMREACISFGRMFGVAFQIVDDIHNFSGSPQWKKMCGEDLRCGKLTYVLLRAMQLLDERRSGRLQEILCSPALRNSQDALIEGIDLVRKSGAPEDCRREAVRMFEEEWHRFSQKVPSSEPKATLRMLCTRLLNITYDA